MITLQTLISAIPAAVAARGDVNDAEPAGGAETAPGPDFASLMAGMLPVCSNPGAPPPTGGDGTDGKAQRGEQEQATDTANGAAAIENAIAIALPFVAPANGAAPAAAAAPIRGQGPANPIELPRSSGAPARTDAGAPRARHPITEFQSPQRAADPAGAPEPRAAAPQTDNSASGFMRAFDLPPQAPDAAPAAPQPELTALQSAPHAAEKMPPAPAAHAPLIDAPLGSARWREDLAGHISVLVRHAASEAEIRVTPPELGPIHAHISVDNGIASVTLSAPAPETRDALEAALATLRERLAESGLALGDANVSGGRAQQFENRAGRFEDHAQHDAPGTGSAPEAQLPDQTARRLRLDGLVDLYA